MQGWSWHSSINAKDKKSLYFGSAIACITAFMLSLDLVDMVLMKPELNEDVVHKWISSCVVDVQPMVHNQSWVRHNRVTQLTESPRSTDIGNPLAPKLTKDSYWTFPSVGLLRKMSDDELKCVPRFIVGSLYGLIEWADADVTNLNLDDIVEIRQRQVQVYHDDAASQKPQMGHGLNKRAKVILFKVLPTIINSSAAQRKLSEAIKQCCENDGSTLINYSPITGIWEFEVEHFSKYGLDDDKYVDSESPLVDAGSPLVDAGSPLVDAGSPLVTLEAVASARRAKAVSSDSIREPGSRGEGLASRFSSAPAVGTLCHIAPQQYDALQYFFDSLHGSAWKWAPSHGMAWNFSDGSDPCLDQWQGLNCTTCESPGSLSYLYGMNLSDHYLEGTIPYEFFVNVTTLNAIDISGNMISGSIPLSIGEMTNLIVLTLRLNSLTGALPTTLGLLSSLLFLDVALNELSSSIPHQVGEMVGLLLFNAHNNMLTGALPLALLQLKNLSDLQLADNSLSSSLPALPLVDRPKPFPWMFDGMNNLFSGTIPQGLGGFVSMKGLRLDNNLLVGTVPQQLFTLSHLEVLTLSNNFLTGNLAASFQNCSNMHLQVLVLSNNFFTGIIPPQIFSMRKLRVLVLYMNCLGGSLPSSACSVPSLEVLSFDGVSSNCKFDILPGIGKGYWTYNQMTGTFPNCLLSFQNLSSLHLAGNAISGTIAKVPLPSKLINMGISNNIISGVIPSTIQQWPFQVLDMSNNRLTGTLDALNVSGPALHGQGTLYLSVNRLSGSIPRPLRDAYSQIAILSGNLFQCDAATVPLKDPVAGSYICGSDNLSDSSYLAASVFGTIILGLSFWHYLRRRWDNGRCDEATVHRESSNLPSTEQHDMECHPGTRNSVLASSAQSSRPSSVLPLGFDFGSTRASLARASIFPQFLSNTVRRPSTILTSGPTVKAAESIAPDVMMANVDSPLQSSAMKVLPSSSILPIRTELSDDFSFEDPKEQHVDHDGIAIIPTRRELSGRFEALEVPDTPKSRQSFFDTMSTIVKQFIQSSFEDWLDTVFDLAVMHVTGLRLLDNEIEEFSNVKRLMKALKYLRQVVVSLGLVSCLVLLPVYIAADKPYATTTYQYGWLVTAAYIQGLVPAVLMMVLWLSISGLTAWRMHFMKDRLRYDEFLTKFGGTRLGCPLSQAYAQYVKFQGSTEAARRNIRNVSSSSKSVWTTMLITGAVLVNCAVILAINAGYVLSEMSASLNLTRKFAVQTGAAVAKLLWNILGVKSMISYIVHHSSNPADNKAVWFAGMLAFNNVVAPCIATAVVNSNCFYYVFATQVPVKSSYSFTLCTSYGIDFQSADSYSITCNEKLETTDLSFVPPFVYSYQCGNAFITNYVPLFNYTYSFLLMIGPVFSILLASIQPTRLPHWFLSQTHAIHFPDANPNLFRRTFDPDLEIMLQVTHILILLTFGVTSIQLCAIVCGSAVLSSVVTQVLVVRYVRHKRKSATGFASVSSSSEGDLQPRIVSVDISSSHQATDLDFKVSNVDGKVDSTTQMASDDEHRSSVISKGNPLNSGHGCETSINMPVPSPVLQPPACCELDSDGTVAQLQTPTIESNDEKDRSLRSSRSTSTVRGSSMFSVEDDNLKRMERACSGSWRKLLKGIAVAFCVAALFYGALVFDVAAGLSGWRDGMWTLYVAMAASPTHFAIQKLLSTSSSFGGRGMLSYLWSRLQIACGGGKEKGIDQSNSGFAELCPDDIARLTALFAEEEAARKDEEARFQGGGAVGGGYAFNLEFRL